MDRGKMFGSFGNSYLKHPYHGKNCIIMFVETLFDFRNGLAFGALIWPVTANEVRFRLVKFVDALESCSD